MEVLLLIAFFIACIYLINREENTPGVGVSWFVSVLSMVGSGMFIIWVLTQG